MVAVRWASPFVDAAWGFELKWDGVRTILSFDGDGVRLRSRAGNDTTAKYPELQSFTAERPTILDGEIVAFDPSGRPSFERLQTRMNVVVGAGESRDLVPIDYVAFDMLYDGVPLLDLPLTARRERLAQLDLRPPFARSTAVDGDPSALWDFVRTRGMEGIVGKRLESPYRPGARSSDWRKITAFRTMRGIVGGFTEGEGARIGTFGSLLLGLWDGDRLRWVGAVGSGFSDAELRAVRGALDQMVVSTPAFEDVSALPAGSTWVAPQLVAMVQYKEWTRAQRLRAPSFKGFTDDPPAAVTWEREGPAAPG